MMKIKKTDRKGSCKILHNGVEVAQVKIKNSYTSSAKGYYNGAEYEFKSSGLLRSVTINKNEQVFGTISTTVWGNKLKIMYTDEFGATEEVCYLKSSVSLDRRGYILIDENDNKLLEIKTKYDWMRLYWSYKLIYTDESITDAKLLELLLYTCYGVRLLYLRMNGM